MNDVTTSMGPLEAAMMAEAVEQQDGWDSDDAFDAADDPEAFNAASAAALGSGITRIEKPQLPMPPDGLVKLPGGIIDPMTLRVVREATVRELTGFDEEQLAKVASNSVAFMGRVVELGTQHPQLTPVDVDRLLIGDRDMLVLAIRRATFGDELDLGEGECRTCGADWHLVLDLSKIEIKTLTGDRDIVHTTRGGVPVRFRLATHADQAFIGKSMGKVSVADQNTSLLARCVVEVDGVDIDMCEQEADEIVRSLGMQDRRSVLSKMAEAQPGPRTGEVIAKCPSCEVEEKTAIDLATTFR